jgi:transglutaminase-like putative cysteine protease
MVFWLDGEGEMVRSQSEFGGGVGALEMTRSTRANALKSFPAPEIMLKTSVEPTLAQGASRSLDRARQIKLRVRNRNGGMVSLPSIGAQKIDEEGLILITIAETSPKEDGVEGDFLGSVPMADTTDEEIIAFAKAGAGHRVGEASRAEALRRAVNRHINLKNLSTAFASASETVRKKSGDCTEHAVLLIAALRSQGIPARAVNGLIWTRSPGAGVSPAYVWHMWTQALIDEEWVDLDATLVGPKGFHTGHLAVSVNDLSRASINKAATQMLEILGDLEIEVLQVETGR